MSIKDDYKVIAKYLRNTIGKKASISQYYDKNEEKSVYIMTINDVLEDGINFYSTIGTSDYSINKSVDGLPLRVELMFTGESSEPKVPNMLSSCAFCIMDSNYNCYPGAIFYNIISSYIKNTDMKHIIFIEPFFWEDKLENLKFKDKIITWLLAIPISETECIYAEKNGFEALEELFEDYDIDVFDLNRKSIL